MNDHAYRPPQGDKEFVDRISTREGVTASVHVKSTVCIRLQAMFEGLAWIRFMKRKELVSWNIYNIRDQVQRLLLLNKADPRVPVVRVADGLKADDTKLR